MCSVCSEDTLCVNKGKELIECPVLRRVQHKAFLYIISQINTIMCGVETVGGRTFFSLSHKIRLWDHPLKLKGKTFKRD